MSSWFGHLSTFMRSLIGVIAAAIVIAVGVFAWIVFGPGPLDFAPHATGSATVPGHMPDPSGVPASLKDASLVERGEYLARAADCEACHTAKGGAPFAGGLALVLPFGTIWTSNITPDKDTGIGTWSDAAFLNAVHNGIDDRGAHLYPAMPYASYTLMTDADVLAIKAYLFSLKPVHNDVADPRLRFPFNQRWLMGVWATLFDSGKRFEPNPAQDAQWNRGAYLAEALEHCGECHTPRTLLQSLNNRRKFAGATQAGWRAYNITQDKTSGVGTWSDADLTAYLATGHADGRGTAAGPMGEAVDRSLSKLAPSDIAALVVYLRTIPAVESRRLPVPKTVPAPASYRDGVTADVDPRGRRIFEGACASCHDWTGVSPLTPMATLTGARAVNDPTATNVAQIVLGGENRNAAGEPVFMPAFGHAYSDVEIAAVANYVTARFGSAASNISAHEVAALRRQTAQ
ncbi:MAG: cytochrome c [Rhizomicrobium sp.]|jgi:mono/diheme cytochrome c family protein